MTMMPDGCHYLRPASIADCRPPKIGGDALDFLRSRRRLHASAPPLAGISRRLRVKRQNYFRPGFPEHVYWPRLDKPGGKNPSPPRWRDDDFAYYALPDMNRRICSKPRFTAHAYAPCPPLRKLNFADELPINSDFYFSPLERPLIPSTRLRDFGAFRAI